MRQVYFLQKTLKQTGKFMFSKLFLVVCIIIKK